MIRFQFRHATVEYYPSEGLSALAGLSNPETTVVITDENVFLSHEKKFKKWHTIILKPGEAYKVQSTVDNIIEQLIELKAGRNFTLVGIGGGVVTDITGYTASIYLRGIRFGFVPTTVLAMVDASVGGKNGVDVGDYKNMAGLVRQPAFILHDLSLLKTLPPEEWSYGFAEIIKHACIMDARMFGELEQHDLLFYMKKKKELALLVKKNVQLKHKVVIADELEKGQRRLLNFGHTLAHAMENRYELPHGKAVAAGMAFASKLSEKILKFKGAARVIGLLEQYELPVNVNYEKEAVMPLLQMDKKRAGDKINFILLEKIGRAIVYPITHVDIGRAL